MTMPDQDPPREPFLRRLRPVPFVIFVLALVFILYQVVGGLITLLAGAHLTGENASFIRWATFLGQLIFILVPTLVLTHYRHGNVIRFLRIRVPETRDMVATMIAVFALQQILQTYMIVQDSIPFPPEVRRLIDTLKEAIDEMYRVLVTAHSPLEFLSVVLIVGLAPAIAEELLFRGLIQRNLEVAVGGLRGAMMTGVIFGAFHLVPFSIVPLVALGMYFGFIVYRSDNITLAMSAHFFNNFVACAAVYLQLDENFVALDPGRKPPGVMIALNFMVFAVVFVLATLYFMHSTAPDDHEEEPF